LDIEAEDKWRSKGQDGEVVGKGSNSNAVTFVLKTQTTKSAS